MGRVIVERFSLTCGRYQWIFIRNYCTKMPIFDYFFTWNFLKTACLLLWFCDSLLFVFFLLFLIIEREFSLSSRCVCISASARADGNTCTFLNCITSMLNLSKWGGGSKVLLELGLVAKFSFVHSPSFY